MMLRINLIVFILSFTTFIGATSVKANCLMFGENERLSNFCLLESVEGKVVDKNTAIIVSQRLMQEGYFGGCCQTKSNTSQSTMITQIY